MILIIACIEPIVGTVTIMISQVLPCSGDAHGLKSTARARARRSLKIELIKAANSLNREDDPERAAYTIVIRGRIFFPGKD